MATPWDIFTLFAELSLLAFGGVNSVLPEMHHRIVDVHHWMTSETFSALYALSQSAPGPNVMSATLIGWHLAGLAGALAATLGILGPPSVITVLTMGVLHRFRHSPWQTRVKAGLVPVTVGLIAASALQLSLAADHAWQGVAITLVTAVAVASGRAHLLALLALGTVVGYMVF